MLRHRTVHSEVPRSLAEGKAVASSSKNKDHHSLDTKVRGRPLGPQP